MQQTTTTGARLDEGKTRAAAPRSRRPIAAAARGTRRQPRLLPRTQKTRLWRSFKPASGKCRLSGRPPGPKLRCRRHIQRAPSATRCYFRPAA